MLYPIEYVPVDKCVDSPHQSRKEYPPERIKSLADSILDRGLIHPIRVVRNNGSFTIEVGHCRVRAYRLLGRDEIEAQIIGDSTDLDLMLNSLAENLDRHNPEPLEICDSFVNVLEWRGENGARITVQQLADAIGWKKATVTNYLQLRSLTENARALMSITASSDSEHKITLAHVRAADTLTPMEKEDVLTKAKQDSLTAEKTRFLAKAYKQADPYERQVIIERPFEELEQGSISIKAISNQRRQEAEDKEKRHQDEDREVKKYFNNCAAFREIVEDAQVGAKLGKFSPESIHTVINRHDRIRAAMEALERIIQDGA